MTTEELCLADWRTQLRSSIRSTEELREYIHLTEAELAAIDASEEKYRWLTTPYYASLMDPTDPECPIRLQAIPATAEMTPVPGATVDPVEDRENLKTRRVIHKYPDRAIVLTTNSCPVYCRHCTRKLHTTDMDGTYYGDEDQGWEEDFDYLRNTPAIRDVLLTGGDPLMLSDKRLSRILATLREIPHIEIVRIGSRFPVVLPQRITEEFCEMLEEYHPVWLNTHFNHPKEITKESAAACDRLLRHGIPVQNQTVLLRGVNDDLETMRDLVTGLIEIRVRPYYVYHCDNVTGVSHLATSLETGREIMRGLLGHTTGFAFPQYVLTTPLGKIPLWEPQVRQSDGETWVRNYEGKTMRVDELLAED